MVLRVRCCGGVCSKKQVPAVVLVNLALFVQFSDVGKLEFTEVRGEMDLLLHRMDDSRSGLRDAQRYVSGNSKMLAAKNFPGRKTLSGAQTGGDEGIAPQFRSQERSKNSRCKAKLQLGNLMFSKLFQDSDSDEDSSNEFAIDDDTGIDKLIETRDSKMGHITSAFGGKFSEIELNYAHPTGSFAEDEPTICSLPPPPPNNYNNTSKDRSNSNSSVSSFHKDSSTIATTNSSFNRRRKSSVGATGMLSSNRHQTKRLVSQFLQSSTDFNCSEQLLRDCHDIDMKSNDIINNSTNVKSDKRKKCHRQDTLLVRDLEHITLQDLLHKDLDISRDSTPGATLTDMTDSTPTMVNSYNPSLVSILRSISPTPHSATIPTPTTTFSMSLKTATPLEALSTLSSTVSLVSAMNNPLRTFSDIQEPDPYHEKFESDSTNFKEIEKFQSCRNHIENNLTNVTQTIKTDLHRLVMRDELQLTLDINHFDTLRNDLNTTKEGLINIQKVINDVYIRDLSTQFDEGDPDSFICQLSNDVTESVTKLEELEQRMNGYKDTLARQKQMIKTLEDVCGLKSNLQETRMNTKYVYQYRFIVIDLFIAACLIYCLMFLKNVVM